MAGKNSDGKVTSRHRQRPDLAWTINLVSGLIDYKLERKIVANEELKKLVEHARIKGLEFMIEILEASRTIPLEHVIPAVYMRGFMDSRGIDSAVADEVVVELTKEAVTKLEDIMRNNNENRS